MGWIRRHKYWTTIATIIIVSLVLDILGVIDAGYIYELCGSTVPIWLVWKLTKKRKIGDTKPKGFKI